MSLYIEEGRVKDWKIGMMEDWKNVRLEECIIGRVYDWKGVGFECVILWIISDLKKFEFFEII